MQKKFLVIIIIAVLVIAIGGAFLWTQKSKTPVTNIQSNTETTNWKTYTNTEHGFEFKYPSNWILENQRNDGNMVNIISPENNVLLKQAYEGGYYYFNFTVKVCDGINSNCVTSGDWIGKRIYKDIPDFLNGENSYNVYRKSSLMPEVYVDNVKGYGFLAGGFGDNFGIMISKNNKIYIINFPSSKDGSNLSIEQKTMLSSFKFTK